MIEDRLADIEIALARQDDLLDTLNTTVWKQQRRIDELEALCTALAQRLAEAQQRITDAGSGQPVHEIPPHY
ncbi:SlyX family protein [Noviherbaspirillum pedocola]|uniref:SlyX family protein n=1 Tax=Noviherbaspirillum pedocola TaxID=2801341 RepID=A0A934T2Q7_9BURK|nr:SlyX family protein [Noviherbaspirillum pedocola]MBK4737063.1 SlyX family protein [Noviherbaspirillum pedocola]